MLKLDSNPCKKVYQSDGSNLNFAYLLIPAMIFLEKQIKKTAIRRKISGYCKNKKQPEANFYRPGYRKPGGSLGCEMASQSEAQPLVYGFYLKSFSSCF